MNILIIGSGGREHAIAKKLIASPHVTTVYCAKGNPRMQQDGIQLVAIDESDHTTLIAFAQKQAIDWVFIGPETPLFHGVTDAFEAAKIPVFSPSQAAAKIEHSKEFAKTFMQKYHIPTARFATFTAIDAAKQYVIEQGTPIVIKADGLAAGKGVVVAQTITEAFAALEYMLVDKAYATPSDEARVVIEEYLTGEEFSLFSFVNGDQAFFAGISQDHKRAFDDDKGPNTGGMGAYSPVPQFDQTVIDDAMQTIILPTIKGLQAEGTPYKGVLYAGLMMTADGIKVIEFNARFGDPETQVVLEQLDSDLATVITDLLANRTPVIKWKKNCISLGVVVAAEGYPATAKTGFTLGSLTVPEPLTLYAAGVSLDPHNAHYIASGGRLFLVATTAPTMSAARQTVYHFLKQQQLEHTFYRHDIGRRATIVETLL